MILHSRCKNNAKFFFRKNFAAYNKDVLPSLQQSMVVYQYVCRCDCRCVGRTSQRLPDRINQHIPRCIRSDKRPTKNLPNRECKITSTPSVDCDSAIGQHLLENKECAKRYTTLQYTTLHFGYSKIFVPFISSGSNLQYINSLQPILCRQKELVYSLQISH